MPCLLYLSLYAHYYSLQLLSEEQLSLIQHKVWNFALSPSV